MDRNSSYIAGARLVPLIIFIFILLLNEFPIEIIVGFVVLVVCIVLVRYVINKGISNIYEKGSKDSERMKALREAQIYLAPHKNIWSNLKLTNRYINVRLLPDGITIICEEKVYPYRMMRLGASPLFTSDEIWNQICRYFFWNKSYDGVVEDCNRYQVLMFESINENAQNEAVTNSQISANKSESDVENVNKSEVVNVVDINNCSEIELTELPGINIVLAKKIIGKREEIGGFKSMGEFFETIKLKPHMVEQLKSRIKIEKMKGTIYKRILNQERSIDF